MKMSVVYSTDDNYMQHAGVSLTSLFEHNQDAERIDVYVIQNEVSEENAKKLERIGERYRRSIRFVDFRHISRKLRLNTGGSISDSSYARLFIASVVDSDVDKVLYLDCDTLVTGSLRELWNTDLEDCWVAGVRDTAGPAARANVGLKEEDLYVNAGVLLINVKKWRECSAEERFVEFIDFYHGNVFHHDQGTINGVLRGKMLALPPKYNAMSVFFTMNRASLLTYYGMHDYYSEKELAEAKQQPVILHFTPAFVNRPWVAGCRHPYAPQYVKYLRLSPWQEAALQPDRRSRAERFVSFIYNYLPFPIANQIRNIVFR